MVIAYHLILSAYGFWLPNDERGSWSDFVRSYELYNPFADQPYASGRLPTPWARKGWWVFVDDVEHLRSAISYVEQNPVKAGLRRQRWSFVSAVRGV